MTPITLTTLKAISTKPLGSRKREIAFKFANFTLLSAPIGDLPDQVLIDWCALYTPEHAGHFNTWYFNSHDNDGDQLDAKTLFHHIPIKDNPIVNWSSKQFIPVRDQLELMVETAEKYGYLAMGCDGNKHRGPSVFAMFLSLAGVDPKESTHIANELFGSNFVFSFVRRRIARLGYELGNERPDLRKRLQELIG